jgi:uncharacterized protein
MILSLLKGKFAVCRLEKSSPIPEWLKESTFCSISRTYDELSFVCSQESIPESIKCNKNWRCFQVEGPLPFNATGIIASLTTPLADAKIPTFVFSTYNTDYFMVKDRDLAHARAVLESEGHTISPKIWA